MQPSNDPRSKRALVDRLMSYDFSGDFRQLGARGVDVIRQAPHKVTLHFKDSNETFELVIRKPAPSRKGINTRDPEARSFSAPEPSADEDEWTVAPARKKRQGIRPDRR